jgi:hypothetical protein
VKIVSLETEEVIENVHETKTLKTKLINNKSIPGILPLAVTILYTRWGPLFCINTLYKFPIPPHRIPNTPTSFPIPPPYRFHFSVHHLPPQINS